MKIGNIMKFIWFMIKKNEKKKYKEQKIILF